jgi:hypothetical protein
MRTSGSTESNTSLLVNKICIDKMNEEMNYQKTVFIFPFCDLRFYAV